MLSSQLLFVLILTPCNNDESVPLVKDDHCVRALKTNYQVYKCLKHTRAHLSQVISNCVSSGEGCMYHSEHMSISFRWGRRWVEWGVKYQNVFADFISGTERNIAQCTYVVYSTPSRKWNGWYVTPPRLFPPGNTSVVGKHISLLPHTLHLVSAKEINKNKTYAKQKKKLQIKINDLSWH